MKELNLAIATELYNSDIEFPVNFDDAWKWLGYTRKSDAKRLLLKYFTKNEDYVINVGDDIDSTNVPAEYSARKKQPYKSFPLYEHIVISVNCIKEMGMLSGTEKGSEIRKYFLECERLAKESYSVIQELKREIQELKNPKQPKQLPSWEAARENGKQTRLNFTDLTKAYIENPANFKEGKARNHIYIVVSDAVNRLVFGKTAKQLRQDRGLSDKASLRDTHSTEELMVIDAIEDIAANIMMDGKAPHEAIKIAIEEYKRNNQALV